MIPPQLFIYYHFILSIAHTFAALFYTAISIYVLIEGNVSELGLACFFYSVAMLLSGIIMILSVQPRGPPRRKILMLFMLIFVVGYIVVQTVFWAIMMRDFDGFVHQLIKREFPDTIITRWVSEHEVVSKVMLFLGVPFYLLWFVSLYIIKFGHF